jgi:hypothetical protein
MDRGKQKEKTEADIIAAKAAEQAILEVIFPLFFFFLSHAKAAEQILEVIFLLFFFSFFPTPKSPSRLSRKCFSCFHPSFSQASYKKKALFPLFFCVELFFYPC